MTRHINFHKIKGLVAFRKVLVEKIHTFENPAYMLTKPLPNIKFQHFLDLVGLYSPKVPFGALFGDEHLTNSIQGGDC